MRNISYLNIFNVSGNLLILFWHIWAEPWYRHYGLSMTRQGQDVDIRLREFQNVIQHVRKPIKKIWSFSFKNTGCTKNEEFDLI